MTWRGVLISLCLSLFAANGMGADKSFVPTLPWSRYEVLTQRNPYSRNRTVARDAGRDKVEAPRPVTMTLFLKGIALRDTRYLAFFEEFDGRSVRAAEGDSLAAGKIEAITLDHVVIQQGDASIKVEVGQSMAYTPSGASAVVRTLDPAARADDGKAVEKTSPSPAGANSILEKLRQRRLKETK